MMTKIPAVLFILIGNLLIAPLMLKGQFTNEFSIGEYVEFSQDDSIRVYFNCTGKICRRSCASFYREGRIDKELINVRGKFNDYFMNDSLAFSGEMDAGLIHGKAKAWYPDGQLKFTGHYKKGSRTGIWKFYYNNGQLKQLVNYVEGFPFITAFFNEKGKQLVSNGNGSYIGEYFTYRTCDPFIFKGKMNKGVLDGKVKIYNSMYRGTFGYEYYENGEFIRGVSGNYNYEDAPKIELPGYHVHELLLLDENTIYCPGFMGTSYPLYDSKIYWKFYEVMQDSLQKRIKYMVEDQWLAIGIGIGFNDEIYDVNVYSSKNDYRLEKDFFNLLIEMNAWESSQVFWRKINTDLFFTVMISKGRVMIPAELMWQQNTR